MSTNLIPTLLRYKSMGLTSTAHIMAMELLWDNPQGLTMTQLAKQCDVCSAAMTGIVNILLGDAGDRRKGQPALVERKDAKEDRRKILVRLTKKGGEFMQSVHALTTDPN